MCIRDSSGQAPQAGCRACADQGHQYRTAAPAGSYTAFAGYIHETLKLPAGAAVRY